MPKLSSRKKNQPQPISNGRIIITATFNNTLVSIADQRGNILAWATSGSSGFKGTKKSTPYAASQAMKKAIETVKPYNLQQAQVVVSGVGSGRDAAVRAIGQSGITITGLVDRTPIPHNGPRPQKPRRV